MTTLSPEFQSECRIREAALNYHLNVRAFQAGRITADEHRAENRRIKTELTHDDNEWEKAKFRVMCQL